MKVLRTSSEVWVGRYEELVSALGDPDDDVVFRSATALGDLGDPRAVPVLVGLLQMARSHRVANGAAIGLRELADPRALEPLLRRIRDPENWDYNGTLIYGLETLDARSAVVDLARFICDGEYEAAWMSAVVMEAFEGPLDREGRREAMAVLEVCLLRDLQEEWRLEMIQGALDLLRECEEEGS